MEASADWSAEKSPQEAGLVVVDADDVGRAPLDGVFDLREVHG
ncbi:MAG: hypothetical protein ACI97A_000732 [Planctomycetota bacterium]|jgi:hypothetical protein